MMKYKWYVMCVNEKFENKMLIRMNKPCINPQFVLTLNYNLDKCPST